MYPKFLSLISAVFILSLYVTGTVMAQENVEGIISFGGEIYPI